MKGKKVLLVEDNEFNLEIAQMQLEDEGVEVVTACDGVSAVETYKASKAGEFDFILMDIVMPGMNGLEAAEKIRKLDRVDAAEVKIIGMSAETMNEVMAEGIEKTKQTGINCYLTKPLRIEDILTALQE